MLGKLFKHEFLATGRVIPFIYLASAAVMGLNWLAHTTQVPMFIGSSAFLAVIAIFACFIVTYVVIIKRYYTSMLGRAGYLTNTLPVPAGHLVFTKTVVSLVWLALSSLAGVLMILGLAALFDAGDLWSSLQAAIGAGTLRGFLLFFLVSFLIEMLFFVISVQFCITLSGSGRLSQYGAGMAFVLYLVLYMATQIVNLVAMLFVPLGIRFGADGLQLAVEPMYRDFFRLMEAGDSASIAGQIIGIGSFVIELILCVVLYLVTVRLAKRKLSLR